MPSQRQQEQRIARAQEQQRVYNAVNARTKRATNAVRRAEHGLYEKWSNPAITVGVMMHFWELIETELQSANEIITHLPDSYFEAMEIGGGMFYGVEIERGTYNQSDELLEQAEALVSAIIARRKRGHKREIIAKLRQVNGCTEPEAASRLAAADAMERQLDNG